MKHGDTDSPRLEPNRGATILFLGLISIMPFQLLGSIPWIMANHDLREMDAGRMESQGRWATVVGKYCGIVATTFCALVAVGLVLAVWSKYLFG